MLLKKKIDPRLRTLIENGVNTNQRTMFFIVGDYAREQVVNLHLILSKTRVRSQPNVLWCYKNELGFSSNRQRRAEKIRKQVKNGVRDKEAEDPFELFLCSTDIRYTYYKETEKVLGQTFGMCVLQDFESLTPNILARTIETVEGGGIICILLKNMTSLRQLYSMTMDVHNKYVRDSDDKGVTGRFNERFILSLSTCKNAAVVDDELNILPISSHIQYIQKINRDGSIQDLNGNVISTGTSGNEDTKDFVYNELEDRCVTQKDLELRELKQSLQDTQPIGNLLNLSKTLDQAKAVLTFTEAIADKSLKATVALLAARGRGKSAALGISLASAIAFGYANIFVTAPTPENVQTLFTMCIAGFTAIGYKEHIDYELVHSLNPKHHKAIVRINIFHSHRQTIQYILPNESHKLSQAELLIIDEAAAIPLPWVKKLMGPYLIFISSTVNGYEGTGRALSLKLIKQLREQCQTAHHSAFSSKNKDAHKVNSSSSTSTNDIELTNTLKGRTLREITLQEPIRYSENDKVEEWLNNLLCLNCTSNIPKLSRTFTGSTGVPHPSQCELYYVERDTLFAYHKATESFLQKMMSLYISSHYKNSPNDLQLIADAPAHHLFVLLGPQNQNSGVLPDIICVIQVCLEGEISQNTYIKNTTSGTIASGNLIPWCISQQYQNSEFASLSGARVVRIAVHPELQNKGYGQRALELLSDYYNGKFTNLEELDSDSEDDSDTERKDSANTTNMNVVSGSGAGSASDGKSSLLTEVLTPRKSTKPLLNKLSDRKPEILHWLGVSFGLTLELFRFWSKNQFIPLYIRQSVNDATGEHTCVMIKAQVSAHSVNLARKKGIAHDLLKHNSLATDINCSWLYSFFNDFKKRFTNLLSYDFRNLHSILAYNILKIDNPSFTNNTTNLAMLTNESGNTDETEEGEDTNALPLSQQEVCQVSLDELQSSITPYDMKRLEAYSSNMIDYHLILDLLPALARYVFYGRMKGLQISDTQATILLGLGLQHKHLNVLENEITVGATQLLALFNKLIRKYTTYLTNTVENRYKQEIIKNTKKSQDVLQITTNTLDSNAVTTSLTKDLSTGAKNIKTELSKKSKDLLASLSLEKYAIDVAEDEWEKNQEKLAAAAAAGKTVSMKASQEKAKQLREFKDQGTHKDKMNQNLKRKAKEEANFTKNVRSEMKRKYKE